MACIKYQINRRAVLKRKGKIWQDVASKSESAEPGGEIWERRKRCVKMSLDLI